VDLGFEVAGFTAVPAHVLAILDEADVVLALTEGAIAVAPAIGLRLVAQHADEFVSHGRRVARRGVIFNRHNGESPITAV